MALISAARQQLCDESMATIRGDLSMPDPECELWTGLTENQRIVILMAAGLPDDREGEPWDAFSLSERQAMCDQIHAFGRITAKLRAFRWRS